MTKLTLLDPTKTGRPAQDLESKLRRFVVGQEEAIHEIVKAYQSHLTGLSPAGRPIGNFLFLGPTGSGKTRIVEATAHALLSQEALNRHHTEKVKISLVLFDEIEKASDALWNLLLGILDKGVLSLGDNRKVDFSSAMIFMTSNLGAGEMCSLLNP